MLGPIAGVVIDRFNRKHVLIGADLFRAALVLSLLWPQGVRHAYLVAAGLAAGTTSATPRSSPDICRASPRQLSVDRLEGRRLSRLSATAACARERQGHDPADTMTGNDRLC